MRELRGESWRARASNPKEKVQAPGVGITARGADFGGGPQGSDPLPALGRTRPWFEVRFLDTYELLNKSD